MGEKVIMYFKLPTESVMKKCINIFIIFIANFIYVNYSHATEKVLDGATQGNQEFNVNYNCKTLKDIELRVFHALFYTQERAELTYEIIKALDKNDQLNYLKVSADADSLDSGSKGKGGDIGYIYYGFLYNENSIHDINKFIYKLPIDTLSLPTQSEFGWHLFWVENARDINSKQPCTYPYWLQEY